MAIPPYFQQTPYFLRITGVSDVQQIIDGLKGVGGPTDVAGWSNPSGDIIRMPTNSVGQYLQFQPVRIGATELNANMQDDLSVSTLSGEIQISGTVTVDCYFGAGYLYFETSAATPEFMGTFLLSESPEAQNAHRGYGAFTALRTTAGTLAGDTQSLCPWNFSTMAYDASLSNDRVQQFIIREYTSTGAITTTNAGFRRWYPVIVTSVNGASNGLVMSGRVPNAVWLQDPNAGAGTRYTIPIDEATTASFVTLGMRQATTPANTRWAIRVP